MATRQQQFEATKKYQDALAIANLIALRGGKEKLNELIENKPDAQIINDIVYATKGLTSGIEEPKVTPDGIITIGKDEDRKFFQNVLSKMPCKNYVLLPLIFGIKDSNGEWTAHNSLLIKCQKSKNSDNKYVDLMGLLYQSFDDFLDKNKLPLSTLCYPPEGILKVNDKNDVLLESRTVGVLNALMSVADTALATFGFFHPNLPTSVYFTFRGIQNSHDAHHHGLSINPLQNPDSLVHWFQVFSNVAYVTSVGLQCPDLFGQSISNATLQSCNNITALTGKMLLTRQQWNNATLGQEIEFCAAICFAHREIFTIDNLNRLMENVQLETLATTFSKFTQGDFDMTLLRKLLKANKDNVIALLNLARDLIRLEVSLTPDLITISILGHKFLFKNFLSLTESDLNILLSVLQAVGSGSIELFAAMHQNYGLAPLLQLINNRSTAIGDNFPLAVRQVLSIMNATDGITAIDPTNQELLLRTGQRITINGAVESLGDNPGASPALRDLVGE